MASIMTVRATDSLRNDLKQIATQRGLTRNALILNILQEWMKKEQKENEGIKKE